MDEDIFFKRLYVYENIYKLDDHTEVINYINKNNIQYSENNNGIFLNISVLKKDTIDHLYKMIHNIQNYKYNLHNIDTNNENIDENIDGNIDEEFINEKEINKTVLIKDKKIDYKITLNEFNFNEHEKNIILESKNIYN